MSLALQSVSLQSCKTDLVLDVQGGGKLRGARGIVYTVHGRDNQNFFFDQYGRLVPAHCPSLCMDVKGKKYKKGAPIIFWDKKEPVGENQRWELTEEGYLCCAMGMDLVVGAVLGPGKRSLVLVPRSAPGAMRWEWRPPAIVSKLPPSAEDDLEDDENTEPIEGGVTEAAEENE